MKTILLCIITSIFFVSCSADSEYESASNFQKSRVNEVITNDYPANSANPYDIKGKKLYELLTNYYETKKSPNSVSELGQQIRFTSANLHSNSNVTSRLIPFTDQMVDSIMADPDNSMILIVQGSILQNYAKTNLINFLEELIIKREQDFTITYNYITGYESEVLDDTIFTEDERETILTISSISRYSLYSEEERKDKDWDILIGNRPAQKFFKSGEEGVISIIALLELML